MSEGRHPLPAPPSFCCSCEWTCPSWFTQLGAQARQAAGVPLPRPGPPTASSLRTVGGASCPGAAGSLGLGEGGPPVCTRVGRRFAAAVIQERRDKHSTVSLTWNLISLLAALFSNE